MGPTVIAVCFIVAAVLLVLGLVARSLNESDRDRQREAFVALMAEIEADPVNPQLSEKILAFVDRAKAFQGLHNSLRIGAPQPYASPIPTDVLYQKVLKILEANPNRSSCKQLALEVGRWHYGSRRIDGLPTIYDEQAIQNDISVRT